MYIFLIIYINNKLFLVFIKNILIINKIFIYIVYFAL